MCIMLHFEHLLHAAEPVMAAYCTRLLLLTHFYSLPEAEI